MKAMTTLPAAGKSDPCPRTLNTMLNNAVKPVIGITAWSGTGKTTLLQSLIPLFRQHGVRVAVIKHSHHKFDVDKPGKDSYNIRKAGAAQTIVASGKRMALMIDYEEELQEPSLNDVLAWLRQDQIDLILVEGFKHDPSFEKIELWREAVGKSLSHPDDSSIIAVASDSAAVETENLPLLDLNSAPQICDFIMQRLNLLSARCRGADTCCHFDPREKS